MLILLCSLSSSQGNKGVCDSFLLAFLFQGLGPRFSMIHFDIDEFSFFLFLFFPPFPCCIWDVSTKRKQSQISDYFAMNSLYLFCFVLFALFYALHTFLYSAYAALCCSASLFYSLYDLCACDSPAGWGRFSLLFGTTGMNLKSLSFGSGLAWGDVQILY